MRCFVLLVYSALAVSAGLVLATGWYYGSSLHAGLVRAPIWLTVFLASVALANVPLVFYFQKK